MAHGPHSELGRRWAGQSAEVRLAAALLFLIASCHYLYPVLADGYEDPQLAAQAWFYVLRGFEGAALFLLVGVLARGCLVGFVAAWGFIEESQTALCKLATGIANVPKIELFSGLCGRDYFWLGIAVAAILALAIADKIRKQRGNDGMAR